MSQWRKEQPGKFQPQQVHGWDLTFNNFSTQLNEFPFPRPTFLIPLALVKMLSSKSIFNSISGSTAGDRGEKKHQGPAAAVIFLQLGDLASNPTSQFKSSSCTPHSGGAPSLRVCSPPGLVTSYQSGFLVWIKRTHMWRAHRGPDSG